MSKVIFWDFHGTLAMNDWMFSKALHKVLCQCEPDALISIEEFKKKPMVGFPWQDHEKSYTHLTNGDDWWKHAESIFINFYKSLGVGDENAKHLAPKVRAEIIKGDEYSLYDDSIEMLSYFKQQGFTNIILSNHIPELENIVAALGLSQYISECISSAKVGYEKPNPEIYRYALGKLQEQEEAWMVGDSLAADVIGPEGVGIKGVLVRSKTNSTVKYYSEDLRGLRNIITYKSKEVALW